MSGRYTEEQALAHRATLYDARSYDELVEWLATSLDMNDLYWPLYGSGTLFTLGIDSEGGTDGQFMAQIVRGTGVLTTDSQTSEMQWVAYDKGPFAGRLLRSMQVARIDLLGPRERIDEVAKALAASGLVGPGRPTRCFVRRVATRMMEVLPEGERVTENEVVDLTWHDVYNAATLRPEMLSDNTCDVEKFSELPLTDARSLCDDGGRERRAMSRFQTTHNRLEDVDFFVDDDRLTEELRDDMSRIDFAAMVVMDTSPATHSNGACGYLLSRIAHEMQRRRDRLRIGPAMMR